jgi:hypothetical protein
MSTVAVALSPGDRAEGVTLRFENVVYESPNPKGKTGVMPMASYQR